MTIYQILESVAMILITALHLLLLSQRALPVRKVTVANQSVPVLVTEGRTVLMSCRTDKPWFFCLWDTPGHQVILTIFHMECIYFVLATCLLPITICICPGSPQCEQSTCGPHLFQCQSGSQCVSNTQVLCSNTKKSCFSQIFSSFLTLHFL